MKADVHALPTRTNIQAYTHESACMCAHKYTHMSTKTCSQTHTKRHKCAHSHKLLVYLADNNWTNHLAYALFLTQKWKKILKSGRHYKQHTGLHATCTESKDWAKKKKKKEKKRGKLNTTIEHITNTNNIQAHTCQEQYVSLCPRRNVVSSAPCAEKPLRSTAKVPHKHPNFPDPYLPGTAIFPFGPAGICSKLCLFSEMLHTSAIQLHHQHHQLSRFIPVWTSISCLEKYISICLAFAGIFIWKVSHSNPTSTTLKVYSLPLARKRRGRYHGGRRLSSDNSLHSPTVIPPSALDKQSIIQGCHWTFAKITENLCVRAVSQKMNTKMRQKVQKGKKKENR